MKIAGVLLMFLAGTALPATPPEEMYRQASLSFEAGDFESAEARYAELRKEYPKHQLFWDAGLMWARCARDAGEAEKRFTALEEDAPADTRAECGIELAHLALLQDDFDGAEKDYAEWLVGRETDERAEAARFFRAWCLKELGREGESAAILSGLVRDGSQPAWRAEAGLLLAGLRFGSGDLAGARSVYLELSATGWGREARPQALMGCARTAVSAGERSKLLKEIIRSYPDTDEAVEALSMLGMKAKSRGRFGVQVGAYSRKSNAVIEKKDWDRKGKKAAILPRKMGSLRLFAVVLGPFDTREAAEREANGIKASGARAIVTPY